MAPGRVVFWIDFLLQGPQALCIYGGQLGSDAPSIGGYKKRSLFSDPVNDWVNKRLGTHNDLASNTLEQRPGGGFNSELKKFGDPNYKPPGEDTDPTNPPSVENARLTAFDSMAQSLRRRRSMSTLLTGGQGTLDQAASGGVNLMGG